MTDHFDGITMPFEASEPLNLKAGIDADIREKAGFIVSRMLLNGIGIRMEQTFFVEEAIAIALQAERDNCATVAEECEIAIPLGTGIADGASIAAKQIASAIRRQPTHASTKAIEGEKT
jgi:hypothetical protein